MVTDSTSSLDHRVCTQAGVRVVPLQVVIDDVSRPEALSSGSGGDPSAVTPAEVAAALRAGRRVTTSRPAPEAFSAAYAELAGAGHDAVVSVHLSRAMSSTVEAARLAAAHAPVPVTVVDSNTIAMAAGFAVLSGADAASRGATAAEVARLVQRRAEKAEMYFSVPSLEFLRRGGRIGPAAALLGSALSVKPLLTLAGGAIRPYERARTLARAHTRLEELAAGAIATAVERTAGPDVAVHHLDDQVGADRLAERLAARLPGSAHLVVAELSAVLGVHVGPGTLGVVVAPWV